MREAERIAVIGVSANPEKMGFQIFQNIRGAGFQGELIAVNLKGEQILGIFSIKSAGEFAKGVDPVAPRA